MKKCCSAGVISRSAALSGAPRHIAHSECVDTYFSLQKRGVHTLPVFSNMLSPFSNMPPFSF